MTPIEFIVGANMLVLLCFVFTLFIWGFLSAMNWVFEALS